MTREEFSAKVAALETYAKTEPEAYRIRVMLLALFGYGYIFFILLLVIGLLGAFAYLLIGTGRLNYWTLKFGWILLVFAGVIARSLWVSFPTPEGETISAQEAPQLFALIDQTKEAVAGPQVHEVLLTDELNAAISQVPRLGLFGWPKNYLILGLPLLQALSPEQFRAVLAHEMGHLSGRHGRFNGWIYQVRKAWIQLLTRLETNDSWGQFLFTGFFNWYAPYFFAYSFVLARAQEYEADRDAAIVAGPETLTAALINVELAGCLLEEDFYPHLMEGAKKEKQAPSDAYTRMLAELRQVNLHPEASLWLRHALASKTNYDDTHPSLNDRIQALLHLPEQRSALSQPPEKHLPAPFEISAAQQLLGSSGELLAPRLGALWQERLQVAWREQQRQFKEAEQELARLENQARTLPLKPEEAWQRAALTSQVHGSEEALPLVREIVASQPENAEAQFVLGRLLLSAKDSEGLQHLEQAMHLDANFICLASEAAFAFLKTEGRYEEAEKYRLRAALGSGIAEEANAERQGFGPQDTLLAHSLQPAQIAELQSQLSSHPEIAGAYLAQKKLQHFPDKPFYLLALVTDTGWYNAGETEADLLDHLSRWLRFPGPFTLLILKSSQGWLVQKFDALEEAEIYRRK